MFSMYPSVLRFRVSPNFKSLPLGLLTDDFAVICTSPIGLALGRVNKRLGSAAWVPRPPRRAPPSVGKINHHNSAQTMQPLT